MEELGEIEKTERGFKFIEFEDRYNEACTLQQSSLATEPAIWLGCEPNRMHLTKDHVVALMAHLQAWIETESFEIKPRPMVPDKPGWWWKYVSTLKVWEAVRVEDCGGELEYIGARHWIPVSKEGIVWGGECGNKPGE